MTSQAVLDQLANQCQKPETVHFKSERGSGQFDGRLRNLRTLVLGGGGEGLQIFQLIKLHDIFLPNILCATV